MEGDSHGIKRVDVCRETVNTLLPFRLETSKPSVPDDEYPRMIAVNVLRIGRVVDTVVRWRVEQRFQNPHLSDQLCVNPELVEQADGLHGEDHDGLEYD